MFVKETMKVKLSLRDYIRKAYHSDQSAPTELTVRRRCQKGKIENAIKEGGRWYIEVEVTREIKDKN